MAARLALGRGSAAASAASTRPGVVASPLFPTTRTSARRRAFSVSVPVLSAHTTSTLASPSIAGSSLTRHNRRPSRTTPTANAIEVIRIRPSGTIGTSAATMPRNASGNAWSPESWL